MSSHHHKKKGWHHTIESRAKISDWHTGRKKDPLAVLKSIATKRRNGIFHMASLKAVETKRRNGSYRMETYRMIGFKAAATRKKNGTDRHSPETRQKQSEGAFRMWIRRHHHDATATTTL